MLAPSPSLHFAFYLASTPRLRHVVPSPVQQSPSPRPWGHYDGTDLQLAGELVWTTSKLQAWEKGYLGDARGLVQQGLPGHGLGSSGWGGLLLSTPTSQEHILRSHSTITDPGRNRDISSDNRQKAGVGNSHALSLGCCSPGTK